MTTPPSRTNTITHAGGIVVRRSSQEVEYLLVTAKQDQHMWIFPKGHVESGETPEQAALREVREEAGVVATIEELVDVLDFASQQRFALFLMRYVSEVDRHEERAIRWRTFEQARVELTFEESRRALERADARMRKWL